MSDVDVYFDPVTRQAVYRVDGDGPCEDPNCCDTGTGPPITCACGADGCTVPCCIQITFADWALCDSTTAAGFFFWLTGNLNGTYTLYRGAGASGSCNYGATVCGAAPAVLGRKTFVSGEVAPTPTSTPTAQITVDIFTQAVTVLVSYVAADSSSQIYPYVFQGSNSPPADPSNCDSWATSPSFTVSNTLDCGITETPAHEIVFGSGGTATVSAIDCAAIDVTDPSDCTNCCDPDDPHANNTGGLRVMLATANCTDANNIWSLTQGSACDWTYSDSTDTLHVYYSAGYWLCDITTTDCTAQFRVPVTPDGGGCVSPCPFGSSWELVSHSGLCETPMTLTVRCQTDADAGNPCDGFLCGSCCCGIVASLAWPGCVPIGLNPISLAKFSDGTYPQCTWSSIGRSLDLSTSLVPGATIACDTTGGGRWLLTIFCPNPDACGGTGGYLIFAATKDSHCPPTDSGSWSIIHNDFSSTPTLTLACNECPDCTTCCTRYLSTIAGSSDGTMNAAASASVSGTACAWTVAAVAFIDRLECDAVNDQWKFTRTRLSDSKRIIFTAPLSDGCPEDGTWSVDDDEIGGSPTLTVACDNLECPGDCSTCADCFILVISSDVDPYSINNVYTFNLTIDSCNWTDGAGNTLSCDAGVWSFTFPSACGGACSVVFTAPVDDSGCPPVNNDTTWTFASCTPGEGATCPDPDPTYALGFESCP